MFSPDNDGHNDFLNISIETGELGTVCTIRIFNTNGILAKSLVDHLLIGTNTTFVWDGTDNYGLVVPIGVYVILVEMYGLNGRLGREKIVCGVVKRYN